MYIKINYRVVQKKWHKWSFWGHFFKKNFFLKTPFLGVKIAEKHESGIEKIFWPLKWQKKLGKIAIFYDLGSKNTLFCHFRSQKLFSTSDSCFSAIFTPRNVFRKKIFLKKCPQKWPFLPLFLLHPVWLGLGLSLGLRLSLVINQSLSLFSAWGDSAKKLCRIPLRGGG